MPPDLVKSASPGGFVEYADSPTTGPDSAPGGGQGMFTVTAFLGGPGAIHAEKLCSTLGLLGKQRRRALESRGAAQGPAQQEAILKVHKSAP